MRLGCISLCIGACACFAPPAPSTRPLPTARLAVSRLAAVRMEVFVVGNDDQLSSVLAQAGRSDGGIVVVHFTEAAYQLANAEISALSDRYEDNDETLFIQVTRDNDLTQQVICGQRGVSAFPTTQLWQRGQRVREVIGESGAFQVERLLKSYGQFTAGTGSSRR